MMMMMMRARHVGGPPVRDGISVGTRAVTWKKKIKKKRSKLIASVCVYKYVIIIFCARKCVSAYVNL